MTVSSPEDTVQVIGGGVAGLNCAVQLHQRSIPFRLLESNDQLGGRIRTDLVDGFRLDRGFQVFQSAYPEARAALDYKALRLKRLVPGALVRRNSKWVPMVDPIRYPKSSLSTIFRAIGNLSDRGKLAKLLWDVRWTPLEKLMSSDGDQPSMELLAEDYAFSEDFLKSFLIPWLSGIFLEP